MIELNSLAMQSLDIAEKRNKNGAKLNTDTVSMLKHCATEIVETTEAYCRNKEEFISELADIICCVLIIAGHEKIDIELAIKKCVEKNVKRAAGIGDKK